MNTQLVVERVSQRLTTIKKTARSHLNRLWGSGDRPRYIWYVEAYQENSVRL